ncbi:MAG: formate dehydrogenase subunit delta [Nevskiaceae bacterium]|jgi:formate dehydrogenase subunit delta|nr:formate dehydrogenase subunit delta [Nevskiaceae bacterium]
MNIEHLITMANDIGEFFDSEMGSKEAPQGIALHISRYWDPRMRTAIIEHAADGGAGLSASALAAVKSLPAPSVQR